MLIDLKCDGKLLQENFLVNFGATKKQEINKKKIAGISLLRDYEIKSAIKALKWGLEFDRNDPEIYFYFTRIFYLFLALHK